MSEKRGSVELRVANVEDERLCQTSAWQKQGPLLSLTFLSGEFRKAALRAVAERKAYHHFYDSTTEPGVEIPPSFQFIYHRNTSVT